jgi:hypothetical protein
MLDPSVNQNPAGEHPITGARGNYKKTAWDLKGIVKELKEWGKENPLAAGWVGILAGLGVLAVILPKKKR